MRSRPAFAAQRGTDGGSRAVVRCASVGVGQSHDQSRMKGGIDKKKRREDTTRPADHHKRNN